MNPACPDGYEQHPLLNMIVRDIASRGEGVLVAVTHDLHSHGTVRVARIRPASGVEWTTAADNIHPLASEAVSAHRRPHPADAGGFPHQSFSPRGESHDQLR